MERKRRFGRIRLIAIVVFWLLMAYLLWDREFRLDPLRRGEDVGADGYFFEALSYSEDNLPAGLSCTLITPTKDGGTRIEHRGSVALGLLPISGPVGYAGQIDMTEKLDLKEFRYQVQFEQGTLTTTGVRLGDKLKVRFGIGGVMQEMTFPIPDQGTQLFTLSLPLLAKRIPFEEGKEYRIRRFNVFTNHFEDVEIHFKKKKEAVVGAELVEALPMDISVGEIGSSLLVTKEGRTLREKTSLGISSEHIRPKDLLFDLARKKENLDVIQIVPIVESKLKHPDGLMEAKVRGVSLNEFDLSVTKRQRWIPESKRLAVQSPANLDDVTSEWPLTFLDDQEIMCASPKVQQAAEIVLGTMDVRNQPREAVNRLLVWVNANIHHALTIEPTDATGTLANLKGDPVERTWLFVELCRSVGLPVTRVTGLAYQDGGFFLKRWARIHLDGDRKDIEVYPPDQSAKIDETWIQLWENEPKPSTMAWLLTNLDFEEEEDSKDIID